jgi:hypothetical protein
MSRSVIAFLIEDLEMVGERRWRPPAEGRPDRGIGPARSAGS